MEYPITATLPLLRIGKDSAGDIFPPYCLEQAVRKLPKDGVPVTIGVDGPRTGTVKRLSFDGQVLSAEVRVNAHASDLITDGWELAACGAAARDGEFVVTFMLQAAALTQEKVP